MNEYRVEGPHGRVRCVTATEFRISPEGDLSFYAPDEARVMQCRCAFARGEWWSVQDLAEAREQDELEASLLEPRS